MNTRSAVKHPSAETDFLIACLLSILWAPSFFVLKEMREVFSFTGLGLLRFTLVNAGFWLLLRQPRFREALHVKMPPTLWQRAGAVSLGLLLNGPAYMVYYFAMRRTVGAEATLLLTSAPILLALGGAAFLRERLPRLQVAGLLLGLCGVYGVVTGGWGPPDLENLRSPGNLLVLAGVGMETAATLLAVSLVRRSSGIGVISHSMFGNLLFFSVASGFTGNPLLLATPTAVQVVGFLYLSLVCGLALFGLWYWVMERQPIGLMGITLYVQAPTAALYGWLVYGQILPAAAIQGGVLILLGLWLSCRK